MKSIWNAIKKKKFDDIPDRFLKKKTEIPKEVRILELKRATCSQYGAVSSYPLFALLKGALFSSQDKTTDALRAFGRQL